MAGEPGAIWIPAAHHWIGREGVTPRYIVIHGTAGFTTAEQVGYFFQDGSDPNRASTHYVIGLDGTIVQCVDENDAAWANGGVTGISGVSGDGYGNGQHDWWWGGSVNPNLLTIAIEHVKPNSDNSNIPTPAQAAASARLVTHICQRWGIPQRKADQSGGITGHYAIDPLNKAHCPGPFPWDQIYSGEDMSIELSTPGVGNFFEGTDTRWHCRNTGSDIFGAILSFYKTFGGAGLCGLTHLGLPKTGEVSFGEGRVYQRFERGVLCYDPDRTNDGPPGASGPVYLMHIDSGLGQDPRIGDLESQLGNKDRQLVALSLDNASLEAQVEDLKAQVATLQTELANCGDTTVVEGLRKQIAELQAEITDLEDRMHQIATLAA